MHKNVFKQIFRDGWQDFKRKHPRYESADEVVQKMLGCGEAANGHAVYVCPDCQERRVVAFSCKSQFCLSCAKVYGEAWVETVQAMLHPGVKYRHLILTLPEGLRLLIYQHAADLLSGLMQAVQTTMDAVVARAKRQPITLGYIVVLQTAGRSANYNPHLHILLTDGGLRSDGRWQRLGYLPYDLLHRIWQTHVLELISTRLAGDAQAQSVVAEMRRRYPRGFVAHLQGNVLPRLKQLTRYLVKYVVSPPLALSRIVAYDREQQTVTYWYRDHLRQGKKTVETVSRETFIGRMVQHILPKGFHRIRYYGLQATCTLSKVRAQLLQLLGGAEQQALPLSEVASVRRPGYRERMRAAFGRDGLLCPRCGQEMWLWQIWHPKYGVIYDELERMKAGEYERVDEPVCGGVDADRARDAGSGPDGEYSYRCSRCRHEDAVPDVVIMGFAASGGCKPGQMPRLACPNCGGVFRALGQRRPRAAR
jgi:DNA-directed RNA polymerase subunit RPC12/RpoP